MYCDWFLCASQSWGFGDEDQYSICIEVIECFVHHHF
jgi:hypothetical protein